MIFKQIDEILSGQKTQTRRECKVCHAVKPLSEFHMDNRGGRAWTCKRCDVAKKNERIQQRKVTDPEWYAGYLQRASENLRRNRIRRVLSAARGGQS